MVDLTPRNLEPGAAGDAAQSDPAQGDPAQGDAAQSQAVAAARAIVRRRRLVVASVITVLVIVAGFVAIQGLQNATLFFRNADEAIAQRDDLGERRFRLQGRVVPSTVTNEGGVTTFDVIHNCEVVSVRHTTDPPELFSSPWIPVVLEGVWAPGAVANTAGTDSHYFLSDRMLVKHTNEYAAANEDRVSSAAADEPIDVLADVPDGVLTECSSELQAAAS